MGSVFTRAIEAAGLSECHAQLASGAGLPPSAIEHLRSADLLLVAALADGVRSEFRGDEVEIVPQTELSDPGAVVFEITPQRRELTGAELLHEIALLRLQTPADKALAVSFDVLGLELAQTALLFGADVLFGDLGGKRTLPLLDGAQARRAEIEGLITRSGRIPRFRAPAASEQETQP